MAKDNSFDIVSETDMQEFENAVNNAHLLFVIRTGNINNLKDQIGV